MQKEGREKEETAAGREVKKKRPTMMGLEPTKKRKSERGKKQRGEVLGHRLEGLVVEGWR